MRPLVSNDSPWTIPQKWLFRFFFAYYAIYIFPFPINYFSFIWKYISAPYGNLINKLVLWTGQNVLHIPYEFERVYTGSGDTTFDYVWFFVMLCLAVLIAILWSIFDRKRKNYRKLWFFAEIFVRYWLAFILISYGLIKIIKTQFSGPGPSNLLTYVGDLSPMALAWTFMGHSEAYNLFAGLGEFIAGALLFWRRTRVLGCVVAIGVMSNVVAMNFTYDVTVKLFSLHLLVTAFLLLVPDLKRIINFAILNRAVAPSTDLVAYSHQRWKYAHWLIKFGLIGFALFMFISNTLENQKKWGSKKPLPPMYGIYEIQQKWVNQVEQPLLLTDTSLWRRLLVQWENHAFIEQANRKRASWTWKVDTATQTIDAYSNRDSTRWHTNWKYELEEGQLTLKGVLEKDTIEMLLIEHPLDSFKLLSRKFHWINERSYY